MMGGVTGGSRPLNAAANDGPRRESWWACEDGGWQHFDTRSARCYNKLDPEESFESRRFFFQRLQMIKRSVEGGKLTFKWHVSHVSPGALIAALNYLDRDAPKGKAVRLIYNYGGWHKDEVERPESAIEQIMRLQCLRGVTPILSTQIVERPFEAIEDSPSLIQRGLRAWQHSGGSIVARSTTALMPRSLVFTWSDELDELVFDHIGHLSLFAQTYGKDWRELVRGRRSDEGMPGQQVDERRLARPYLDVLASWEPRFEHARVPIREKTGETTWRTYHRLLLPFRSERGKPHLLCLCADSLKVDLPRLLPHVE